MVNQKTYFKWFSLALLSPHCGCMYFYHIESLVAKAVGNFAQQQFLLSISQYTGSHYIYNFICMEFSQVISFKLCACGGGRYTSKLFSSLGCECGPSSSFHFGVFTMFLTALNSWEKKSKNRCLLLQR